MSKLKPRSTRGVLIGYGSAYAIQDYQIQNLVGKLLTFVESMGFSEVREKAVKDIVKQEIYSNLTEPCFIISAEEHTHLRNKHDLLNEGSSSLGNVVGK